MIFQKGLQIFLAVLAEEEPVDLVAKLLEGPVARGEERATRMSRRVIDSGKQAGLGQPKLEGREPARDEVDDLGSRKGRRKNGINAMDHTIFAKLDDAQHQSCDARGKKLTMLMATTRL